jgi:glutaredoxin-like protein
MALLSDEVLTQLKTALAELTNPVKLIVFTQAMECQFCRENRELANELAAVSDKIVVEIYNYVLDKPQVEKYKIDRIPALVVEGTRDYGIRFYGIPAGFEFTSLIEAIKMVSKGDPGLTPDTLERIKALTQPMKIQVFVTLTCPYCPAQVHLAHQLSMAHDLITGEMIEAAEFPYLANRYAVNGVPKTIINDKYAIVGAIPEDMFVNALIAIQSGSQPTGEQYKGKVSEG